MGPIKCHRDLKEGISYQNHKKKGSLPFLRAVTLSVLRRVPYTVFAFVLSVLDYQCPIYLTSRIPLVTSSTLTYSHQSADARRLKLELRN